MTKENIIERMEKAMRELHVKVESPDNGTSPSFIPVPVQEIQVLPDNRVALVLTTEQFLNRLNVLNQKNGQ